MNLALLIRLRPLGPWRFGPSSGARDRVDLLLHSDVLFSAVTLAFEQLGLLDEWLGATVRSHAPEVALSSLYPFLGRTLYAIPPRNLWPPLAGARVRWKGARFVPLSVVSALMRDQSLAEERWVVDPISQCLLNTDRSPSPNGPFRVSIRSAAAIDRVTQAAVEVHTTACLEFSEGAGLWCVATFADVEARARWADRMKAAFRLLADSGLGGERSRGWGRASDPEFSDGNLNELLFPPSQKLKDIRPRPPKPLTEATVGGPAVTAPLASQRRDDQPNDASLNPPPEPVEPDATRNVTSSLNPPLEPVEPDLQRHEPVMTTEADASLNPPLEPVEPDGTANVTESLNPPLEPVEPDATANVTESLNPPLEPVEPDVTANVTESLNPPLEPVEPDATANVTESLNPPLEPVEPDTQAKSMESLNPPLEPVQPDVQGSAKLSGTGDEEPPNPPEGDPEPDTPPEEEPGPEPLPHTEPGPEPPPEHTGPLMWEPPEESKPGKAYWLLSLFAPATTDAIDWARGSYSLVERSGRIHSGAGFGRLKQTSQMVEEGSVLFATEVPSGVAQNVAPEGFSHPVYRTGFAVSVEVPWRLHS